MDCCRGEEAVVGLKGRARGFEAATVDLHVDGMSCGACARRIERALADVGGVASASVDLAGGRVRVAYEPGIVGAERIASAIRELGYEVRP